MKVEFKPEGDSGLLGAVANSTGSILENGLLMLPEPFGQGYIKGVDLGPFLKLMISQCTLQEDLVLKRSAAKEGAGTITFSFRNVFNQQREQKDNDATAVQHNKHLPSVQISSDDIDIELFFPAKTPINTILITTQVNLLSELMNWQDGNPLLQTILSGSQPYLYEELISPEIQQVATDMVALRVPASLHDFYYKIKAQELICLFFVALLKRQDSAIYPVNTADINIIYLVRDKVISELSIPPNLPELARFAGMSESKMKRLFKQIFGDSIYSYYQTFRMHEAAYLIKEQRLSVTETGLRLGFSNLSHFTRIFEKHTGHKPKKYSTV